jgi:hypothetical protein
MMVANIQQVDAYSNLSSLTYVSIENGVNYSTDTYQIFSGGDAVVAPMELNSIFNYDTAGALFNDASIQGAHIDSL